MLPDLTSRSALFLDLDGTLAPIVEEPGLAAVPREVRAVLQELQFTLGGAIAIVSGRPIAEVDRLLGSLVLPVAGVHGLERRGATGVIRRHLAPDLAPVIAIARRFAERHPGLLVEEKPGSVALHFRKDPSLGVAATALLQEALADRPDLRLLEGKMVVEAKSAAADKGHAIAAFRTLEQKRYTAAGAHKRGQHQQPGAWHVVVENLLHRAHGALDGCAHHHLWYPCVTRDAQHHCRQPQRRRAGGFAFAVFRHVVRHDDLRHPADDRRRARTGCRHSG